jgi:arylsulfatase
MRDTDVPLPLLFKDQGYRTGSFSDNPYISKTQGLDKGYSHFEYHYYQKWRKDAKNGSSPPSGDRERSEFLFDQLEKWIHNGDTDPWFAYIHTLRPHNTYAPPEPYLSKFADTNLVPENEDSREYLIEYERKIFHRFLLEGRGSISDEQRDMLHDMYLSSINYIDHLIDNLFSSLQEAGQLENTLIIITSDHGEAFGEHGRFLHGGTPHRPLNHVPLIIIPPKHMNLKPIRVSTPVPLLDLLPTLTEIFQLSDPTPRDGQSLTPLMRGDQGYENKPIFSQSPFELAVIKDNRKLIIKTRDQIINLSGEESIVPTETEIFDLNADPQENNNLYQPGNDYPILMALRESYLDRQGTISTFEIPVLPDEEREALESLGYLDK